jgi:hypothetical protein
MKSHNENNSLNLKDVQKNVQKNVQVMDKLR